MFIGMIFQRHLHPWNKASAETRNKTISLTTTNDLAKTAGSDNAKICESKPSDKSLVKFLPSGRFTSGIVAKWLRTN